MLLLLAANVGMWTFSGLVDPPAIARSMSAALEDRVLRDRVSRELAGGLAEAILEQGPLPGPVRRVLGLPANSGAERLAGALADRIDGLLADAATGPAAGLATTALSQVVEALIRDGAAGDDATRVGLVVDLTPIGRMVLDSIDPSGELGGGLPPGAGRVRLLDAGVMAVALPALRLADAVLWSLPLACLVGVVLILVLARYRVHALAWVGLCCVVAGTASLLLASGGPVLVPRAAGMEPVQAAALTSLLDDVTAGLVTQSAVLAGLGLALVVAGIAGGVVVSHGETGRDPRHDWDAGRLS